MDITLYMWEDYREDEFSGKIITLLQLVPLEFKIHPFEKDIEMDVVSVVEEQLVNVRQKVATLSYTVEKLKRDLVNVEFELSGITIYLNDMKDIRNEKRRE